jgi:LAGLIDADG endonuclease
MNLQAQWTVGFVDGEGCFHIGINKNSTLNQVLVTVTQHKRDVQVLYALNGCGVVRVNHGDVWCFRVRKLSHLHEIIVPFFEKHKLLTKKRIDFDKFRTVILMMHQKHHLTLEGVLFKKQ